MGHEWDVVAKAADAVASRLGRAPVGVVLGSGLSECLDHLEHPQVMEYASIPGMPRPSTAGHRGAIIRGTLGDVPVLGLCGRIHVYEGRPAHEVAMGVRVLSLLGVHSLVVTSAVGSLDPALPPGSQMIVEDHMNLSGANVLAGEHEPRFGPRFPDLTRAYDPVMSDILEEVGRMVGVELERGIVAQFLGPTYETPAEVRMARTLGARVASMSMVPDVLVARQRGMRVAGVGCVTNLGAGLGKGTLAHDDVLASSAVHAADLQSVLAGALPRIAKAPAARAQGARG